MILHYLNIKIHSSKEAATKVIHRKIKKMGGTSKGVIGIDTKQYDNGI